MTAKVASTAAPDAERTPLGVREVTSTDELRALGPVWRELHAASETRSPFSSHEWALSWWEELGGGQQLRVLVVEDDEGPAAMAPFALARRRFGPFEARTLELLGTGPLLFLGMGLADRADFLLARRHAECVAAIAEWLAEHRAEWDVMDLRFVPEGSTTVRELLNLAPTRGFGLASGECSRSPYLPLDGTWDDYLAGRGRTFRKGLRRKTRKLEEGGEFDVDALPRLGPERALSEAIAVSGKSWKQERGSALLSHENVQRFLRRLAGRLAPDAGMFVALLTIDGRTSAHELGFRMDGKLWSYDSCFTAEASAHSPGTLLTARLLEHAWSEGLMEYDFLRGGEDYKLTWTTSTRREIQLVLDSGSVRARLCRLGAWELKWLLKRHEWLSEMQARLAGVANRISGGRRA